MAGRGGVFRRPAVAVVAALTVAVVLLSANVSAAGVRKVGFLAGLKKGGVIAAVKKGADVASVLTAVAVETGVVGQGDAEKLTQAVALAGTAATALAAASPTGSPADSKKLALAAALALVDAKGAASNKGGAELEEVQRKKRGKKKRGGGGRNKAAVTAAKEKAAKEKAAKEKAAKEKADIVPVKGGASPKSGPDTKAVPDTGAATKEDTGTGAGKKESTGTGAGKKEDTGTGAATKEKTGTGAATKEATDTGAVTKEDADTGAVTKEDTDTGAVTKEATDTGAVTKETPSTGAVTQETPSTGAVTKETPSTGAVTKEATDTGAVTKEDKNTGADTAGDKPPQGDSKTTPQVKAKTASGSGAPEVGPGPEPKVEAETTAGDGGGEKGGSDKLREAAKLSAPPTLTLTHVTESDVPTPSSTPTTTTPTATPTTPTTAATTTANTTATTTPTSTPPPTATPAGGGDRTSQLNALIPYDEILKDAIFVHYDEKPGGKGFVDVFQGDGVTNASQEDLFNELKKAVQGSDTAGEAQLASNTIADLVAMWLDLQDPESTRGRKVRGVGNQAGAPVLTEEQLGALQSQDCKDFKDMVDRDSGLKAYFPLLWDTAGNICNSVIQRPILDVPSCAVVAERVLEPYCDKRRPMNKGRVGEPCQTMALTLLRYLSGPERCKDIQLTGAV